jgi:hypothetical protein
MRMEREWKQGRLFCHELDSIGLICSLTQRLIKHASVRPLHWEFKALKRSIPLVNSSLLLARVSQLVGQGYGSFPEAADAFRL